MSADTAWVCTVCGWHNREENAFCGSRKRSSVAGKYGCGAPRGSPPSLLSGVAAAAATAPHRMVASADVNSMQQQQLLLLQRQLIMQQLQVLQQHAAHELMSPALRAQGVHQHVGASCAYQCGPQPPTHALAQPHAALAAACALPHACQPIIGARAAPALVWECAHCTFVNRACNRVCGSASADGARRGYGCGMPRPPDVAWREAHAPLRGLRHIGTAQPLGGTPAAPPAAPPAARAGEWVCVCSWRNSAANMLCGGWPRAGYGCGLARPTGAGAPPPALTASHAGGAADANGSADGMGDGWWRCQTCGWRNRARNSICGGWPHAGYGCRSPRPAHLMADAAGGGPERPFRPHGSPPLDAVAQQHAALERAAGGNVPLPDTLLAASAGVPAASSRLDEWEAYARAMAVSNAHGHAVELAMRAAEADGEDPANKRRRADSDAGPPLARGSV
ncbi:hypothetical protein KFE25_011216 [Diacronema lutheri]|uniref:RanBP2-type domain-containing protein n=1 Tax=Diacronema lutheri TaxID=2081491 RepID=A0A8J5XM87_DIALT|nr:hypothetical protein KFE25_011216 [Diacronema lutheri]